MIYAIFLQKTQTEVAHTFRVDIVGLLCVGIWRKGKGSLLSRVVEFSRELKQYTIGIEDLIAQNWSSHHAWTGLCNETLPFALDLKLLGWPPRFRFIDLLGNWHHGASPSQTWEDAVYPHVPKSTGLMLTSTYLEPLSVWESRPWALLLISGGLRYLTVVEQTVEKNHTDFNGFHRFSHISASFTACSDTAKLYLSPVEYFSSLWRAYIGSLFDYAVANARIALKVTQDAIYTKSATRYPRQTRIRK